MRTAVGRGDWRRRAGRRGVLPARVRRRGGAPAWAGAPRLGEPVPRPLPGGQVAHRREPHRAAAPGSRREVRAVPLARPGKCRGAFLHRGRGARHR